MKNRIIAVLLTVALLLSLFSVSAVAEFGEDISQISLDTTITRNSNGDAEITVYITPTMQVNVAGLAFNLEFENYYKENAGSELQEYFSYNIDEATFGETFPSADLGYSDDNISSTIYYGWESINSVDIDERTELCTIKLKKNDAAVDGRYDFNLTLTEAYKDYTYGLEDINMADGGVYSFSIWVGEEPAFLNKDVEIPITLGTTPVESYIYLNAPVSYSSAPNDVSITGTGYDELLEMYYVKVASSKICEGFLVVETEIPNKPGQYEAIDCKIKTVKPYICFLTVVNNPTKISYNAGETIDPAGLKLLASYSSGEQLEITSGYTLKETEFYTEGQHDVIVHYNEFTYNSCKFKITISPVCKITSNTYNVYENIVCNIAPETTVSTFLNTVQTTGTLTLKDGDNVITDGIIKTGMTLLVSEQGKTDITYNLAVSGDINGDGSRNVLDLMQLKVVLAGQRQETKVIRAAAHGSDDDLSAADLITIKKRILGVNG